jgi:hypothetical protein
MAIRPGDVHGPQRSERRRFDVGEVVWLVVAGVAVGVIGLGWWTFRRSSSVEPPAASPVVEPKPPEAGVAAVAEPLLPTHAPTVAPTLPPAPAVAAAAAPAVTPAPARREPPVASPPAPKIAPVVPRTAAAPAQTAPRVVERPAVPALPKVPRFELRDGVAGVLVLERAPAASWDSATALASTPVQRELLSDLMARAAELDGAAEGEAIYAVRLAAGAALPLARSEGAPAGSIMFVSEPPQALDPVAAANFAAAALALQAARLQLPTLRGQVGETKTVAAALHPKLIAQTEGRLKSLVQDLARYLREAEENYAGAIRKPVFIGRVDAACEQAVGVWQGALAAAAAARSQIETQVQAPRFGEVQLEKSLAALRDLQGQRRVLDAAARILSGWEQLRLLLGDASAGAAPMLREAAAGLAAARDADGRTAAALGACVDAAKAPDYVGKAEFNANRNAVREILAGFDAGAFAAAQAALERATAALDAGFAGRVAQALLVRVDAASRVVDVREPA